MSKVTKKNKNTATVDAEIDNGKVTITYSGLKCPDGACIKDYDGNKCICDDKSFTLTIDPYEGEKQLILCLESDDDCTFRFGTNAEIDIMMDNIKEPSDYE